MKTLVVYTSQYGNTKKIAQAIGEACGLESAVVSAEHAPVNALEGIRLLIVGSPTQGGRPTPALQHFLEAIPSGALQSVHVAAFDTRMEMRTQGWFLRFVMKAVNYAAPKISNALTAKGGQLASSPEGFIVLGKEGPLKEGETERAGVWAQKLQLAAA